MSTGFAAVPRWIIDEGVSAYALAVYVILAAHAAKDGTCWPSQGRIAEMVGLSRPTVRKALEELREINAVEWKSQTNGAGATTSNLYRLRIFVNPKNNEPKGQPTKTPTENPTPLASTLTPPVKEVTTPCKGGYYPLETTFTGTITKEQEPKNNTLGLAPQAGEPESEPEGFSEFWENYPRRVKRKRALAAYAAALAAGVAPEVINEGAARLAADPNLPAFRFIPHPDSWLNAGSWDDPPLPYRPRDDLTPAELEDKRAINAQRKRAREREEARKAREDHERFLREGGQGPSAEVREQLLKWRNRSA